MEAPCPRGIQLSMENYAFITGLYLGAYFIHWLSWHWPAWMLAKAIPSEGLRVLGCPHSSRWVLAAALGTRSRARTGHQQPRLVLDPTSGCCPPVTQEPQPGPPIALALPAATFTSGSQLDLCHSEPPQEAQEWVAMCCSR